MFIVCKGGEVENGEVDVLGDKLPIWTDVIVTLRNCKAGLPAQLNCE